MTPDPVTASDVAHCFSASYKAACEKFQLHAQHEHSQYREFVHPIASGPQGERLILATSWIGDEQAPRVLVTQSATHGAEGFAGSAIQIDALNALAGQANEGLAILHIHALNPFGFAWLRRVNEDGVDLNRNFIDFDQPLPDSSAYAELAPLLVPENEQHWADATARLFAYRDRVGQRAFESAVSAGQYCDADGLFYGGTRPSWSRVCLQQIMADYHLPQRQRVAVVDIHTGLGPYAAAEVICDHPPNSQGVAWAKAWYGDNVTEPALGTSTSVPKTGLIDYAWQQALGERVCFVTLEFGTYAIEQLFEVLRRDHFLHRHQVDWHAAETQGVKLAMREHFGPTQADWQQQILAHGRRVLHQAITGLQHD